MIPFHIQFTVNSDNQTPQNVEFKSLQVFTIVMLKENGKTSKIKGKWGVRKVNNNQMNSDTYLLEILNWR